VDLNEQVGRIESAELLLRDRTVAQVDVAYRFQVTDAAASVLNVARPREALRQLVLTTLQTLVADQSPGDLMNHRSEYERELAGRVGATARPWGITVHSVELSRIET
jgi:regulator of protease activity HflC (stomatin/prohibitin superfamily)